MTTASTRVAQAILQAARELGAAPDDILKAAGLRPERLAEPAARLSCSEMARLSLAAAELSDCPGFGLKLGQAVHTASFGTLGHLLLAAPRPQDALDELVAYQHVLGDGVGMRQHRTPGHTWLRLQEAAGMKGRIPQHSVEARLLVVARLVRDLTPNARVSPTRMRFRHRPRGDVREHERTFGSVVEFGAEEDEIGFRSADLDRPVWGADTELFLALRNRVKAQAEIGGTASPIVARLRGHLHGALGSGRPSLARSAEALALSPRSLQRHLSECGITFQDVLDEVRKDVVRDRLQHGETDIVRIGLDIGYSDESAVRKACWRWFGAPPRAVRKAARYRPPFA